MPSVVEICNLALSNIRGGSINSLNESSLQAQNCKLKYPILRDMLLRKVLWPFAHKIDALALLTDDVFNWAYTYQYPADCIGINNLLLDFEEFGDTGDGVARARHIEDIYTPDLDAQVMYDVINISGNKVIVANEPRLRISYKISIDDPNLFDSEFVQALAWLLAAELAIPIVGAEAGRKLRIDAMQVYTDLLKDAAASSKNERYKPPADSGFITTRL